MPRVVGAALLASAEGYTPRATQLLVAARERLGSINEVAGWIAESLPQPKTGPSRTRRRRRRKKKTVEGTAPETQGEAAETQPAAESGDEAPAAPKKRRRRRKKQAEPVEESAPAAAEPDVPAEDAA
jgi:hypothetical protein